MDVASPYYHLQNTVQKYNRLIGEQIKFLKNDSLNQKIELILKIRVEIKALLTELVSKVRVICNDIKYLLYLSTKRYSKVQFPTNIWSFLTLSKRKKLNYLFLNVFIAEWAVCHASTCLYQ